ncbi:AN1-type zinc finger protein 2B [Exaiptasia diaphana]|nr:AN1-type zinc finger protein 2B [Exaiptasia diaphana]
MEFPNLGQQCALSTCKQLEHSCNQAYKKDNQVPVCPLCNQPVPVPRGQQPDIKVGEHIDRDCQSERAVKIRNKCSVKGCKQKEFMKVRCESCRQNYCLKHRHEQDHNCTALVQPSTTGQRTSASVRAGQAAVARFQSKPGSSGTRPQQTSLSSFGRDLDRERRERLAQQKPQQLQHTSMSEDEALALAIQASLSSTQSGSSSSNSEPNRQLTAQEQEDLALAQALAQSEKEELERRQRGQQSDNKKSDCSLS